MNRLKIILGVCAIIPCLAVGRVGIDSTGEKVVLTGLFDGVGNTVSNIVLVNSDGAGLTGITAAQVGAVATNDADYLAIQNGPLMINATNVVIGYQAEGTDDSVAIGYYSGGLKRSVTVGYSACGTNYGVAIGYSADGNNKGVAVGYDASGANYGVAVGYLTSAASNSVAIGDNVINLEPNSTMLKGNLNMQGNLVTNAPNLVKTNNVDYQNLLTNTATKTQGATADAALPKAGGTMTGPVTNLYGIFVTNGMGMFGGALNGTNGVYWTWNGTNRWILFP